MIQKDTKLHDPNWKTKNDTMELLLLLAFIIMLFSIVFAIVSSVNIKLEETKYYLDHYKVSSKAEYECMQACEPNKYFYQFNSGFLSSSSTCTCGGE